MTDTLNKRVDLRVSEDDKRMVQELAKHMNIKPSDVWRHALKKLHSEQIKPRE